LAAASDDASIAVGSPENAEPSAAVPIRTARLALLAAIVLSCVAAFPGAPNAIQVADAAAPDGRLVVTWRDAAPAAVGLDGVAAVHRSHANRHRSVVVARAGHAGDVARDLRADPGVESVVPDAVGAVADWPQDNPPDDTLYATNQKDFPLIGVPGAWTMTTGSPSVIVGLLDTGYESAHPDLAAIPIVAQWNARTGTRTITDVYGHGTHVAGTIAAQANNAMGVAGVAPGIRIMPVKVMDNNGQGYWSDFLEGVDWARTHGASIINMSLGGTLTPSQAAAFQPTFDAAYKAGVVVVAAAGNNNRNEPFYPASFDHVISVAATTNNDTKASFSNYGPAVDLSAPGYQIMSTYPGGVYKLMSGTSMATPHVVGLAALIRSYHPTYTVDEVETAMEVNAVDLGAAGRDNYFGFGRIQADQAVAWVAPDLTPPVASLTMPLSGTTHVSEWIVPAVGFSEAVTGADGATITLASAAGSPVDATVTYNGALHRATISPAAHLASRTTYVVSIDAGIADLAANPLEPTSFSFTTGDHIAPTVTGVYPRNGATGAWRGVSPKLKFSEMVHYVGGTTLTLRNVSTGRLVAVTVHYDWSTRIATIDPRDRLAAGTWYTIKVSSVIVDGAGNHLATRWFNFKTGG
jgi:subtilisin family serine protease